MKRIDGRVVRMVEGKFFGFIRQVGSDSKKDYFFHRDDLKDTFDFAGIKPGTLVTFMPEATSKGLRAGAIEIVEF